MTAPGALPREAVVRAYRLILGREPESEAVIEAKLRGHRTVADWGARARSGPAGGGSTAEALRPVPGLSVATLLAGLPEVDLLHADLRGEEATALPPAVAALSAWVRRVVIGTHGRAIEEALLRAFGDAGWELEADAPCAYAQRDGNPRPALVRDGTQAWRNPRL